MSRHQEIIFALAGQSFFYDPPEGRPSGSPTVQVFSMGTDDNGTAEVATSGAVTIDSVDTTLDGSHDPGAVTLTLDDGTGVKRGRRYLVTSPDAEELVEVVSVNGDTVHIRQPLLNTYPGATTTFRGCRLSAAVDATWAASTSKLTDVLGTTWRPTSSPLELAAGAAGYRLRWSYTVGGVATIGVSYADLVRYQAKNLVTALDVDRTFPGWLDRLSVDNRQDQGAALVEEAFRAVKMDALADAQLVRRIRDTQILAELVIYRANLLATQNNVIANGLSMQALEVARELYRERYHALIREPKVPVDQTGGGSSGDAQRLPAWRR